MLLLYNSGIQLQRLVTLLWCSSLNFISMKQLKPLTIETDMSNVLTFFIWEGWFSKWFSITDWLTFRKKFNFQVGRRISLQESLCKQVSSCSFKNSPSSFIFLIHLVHDYCNCRQSFGFQFKFILKGIWISLWSTKDLNTDGKNLTNISNANFRNSVKFINKFKDYQKSPSAIRNNANESDRSIPPEMFWKYAENLQKNTHVEVRLQNIKIE